MHLFDSITKENIMQLEHDAQRKRYMNSELNHQEFYSWLANKIGITIEDLTVTTDKLLKSKDPSFNDIPLRQWDKMDSFVRRAAYAAGMKSWSLSDTVCTTKAVARQWLLTRYQLEANRAA